MSLYNTADLLKDAQKNNYCIGAFNIENADMAMAVISAAEKLGAPAIIQTTYTTVNHAGEKLLAAIVGTLAKDSKAALALHLDHGNTLEVCERCINAGYNSVMFDGSHFSPEKNIALTKQVVESAQQKGVSVEGEIGRVGGVEDEVKGEILYTEVAECARFVAESGIDFVAIGVGTAHGIYVGQPKINIKRIAEIREAVDVPLVLHGASGLSQATIKDCIKAGISKINFATELRQAYTKGVRRALADEKLFDPKVYQLAARQSVEETVAEKLRLLQ